MYFSIPAIIATRPESQFLEICGSNAFIMPGAKIGNGVVISAGSVVGGKKIEPYAILAGNPARKISSRLN